MTPRCTNCLHWDEESAEDNIDGLGLCMMSEQPTRGVPPLLLRGNQLVQIARTRGDYSCPFFRGKVAPHVGDTYDAQMTSEANKT